MPAPFNVEQPIFDEGNVLTLPVELDPEAFRSMIRSSPNAEACRWWKAFPDPTFNPQTEHAAAGAGRWNRVEQLTLESRGFQVIVLSHRFVRRYIEGGAVDQSDILLCAMPDEFDFGPSDWVVPLGRDACDDTHLNSGRQAIFKVNYVRGWKTVAGTGTVASSGTLVTGTGTAFSTLFKTGDIIAVAGQQFRITGVGGDGALTIESPPAVAWTGNTFTKQTDLMRHHPLARVDYLADATRTYQYLKDFTIAPDQQTIQWLSATNAPSPGATLAIVYRYWPKYEILPDTGWRRKTVNGVSLPHSFVARLWQPEIYQQ